jgi:hypothetical protein
MSTIGIIVAALAAVLIATIAILERRDRHAIKFANWLHDNYHQSKDYPGKWFSQYVHNPQYFTTEDLYQRFILDGKK